MYNKDPAINQSVLAPWPFKTAIFFNFKLSNTRVDWAFIGLWGFSKAPPVAGFMQMVEMMFERKTLQKPQKSPLVFFKRSWNFYQETLKDLYFSGFGSKLLMLDDYGNLSPSHRQLPREAPHIGTSSGIPNDSNVHSCFSCQMFVGWVLVDPYWR